MKGSGGCYGFHERSKFRKRVKETAEIGDKLKIEKLNKQSDSKTTFMFMLTHN